jgi:hypothetical protein
LFSVALLTLGVDTRHRITLGTKMRIDWSRQVAAKDICVFSWDEAPRDSVWVEKTWNELLRCQCRRDYICSVLCVDLADLFF